MPSSAPVDGVLHNGQRKQISTVLYGVKSTAFCLQMIKCFSKIIMCLTERCMCLLDIEMAAQV
jgi:hypothetical protein